jgi:endonuclease/exonuclease/phosphatase family metal-dependent hydrolase
MGRGYLSAEIEVSQGKYVLVGTTHLESFAGPRVTGAEQRPKQLLAATRGLAAAKKSCDGIVGCLLCGDFNWKDPTKKLKNDGDALACVDGAWADVWKETRRNDPGFTYDGKDNGMLGHWWRNRFDRILLAHGDQAIICGNAQLVGTDKLPGGVTYEKTTKSRGTRVLPVFPSDHFGVCSDFAVSL